MIGRSCQVPLAPSQERARKRLQQRKERNFFDFEVYKDHQYIACL